PAFSRLFPYTTLFRSRIGFTLVAFYICSIVLSFLQHFIMTTIAQIVSRQMRSDITEKINRLPMGFYNKTSHGDILSRVTNDVDIDRKSTRLNSSHVSI